MLLAEEREVCEECVEVRVQTQSQRLPVVTPVNVSQSPEEQQKHLLDQEDEACREHGTWGRRQRVASAGASGAITRPRAVPVLVGNTCSSVSRS